jgi:glycerol-3-phosphate cytidylyltransferase
MGDDWAGKFDYLRELCEVVYLARTPNVSSSVIKAQLQIEAQQTIDAKKLT